VNPKPPFQNDYIFGNLFLESIPHPQGMFGDLLNYFTILCHYMGGITFFLILVPILYFYYQKQFAIKIAAAILTTGLFNGLAKFYFQSPRPSGLSEQFTAIKSHINEGSFGLPSGHSHVSILVWGLIFLHFKNIYIRSFAMFIMIFTPFSRMYAGVHYPGDVIGGFLMGLLTLVVIEILFKKFPDFPNPVSWNKPEATVRSSILLVAVITLSSTLLGSKDNIAQQVHSLEQVISAAGSSLGMYAGIVLYRLKFPELANRNLKDNLLFSLSLLFLGVGLFYVGLGKLGENLFPGNEFYRYSRYVLLNFYVAFLIPYLVNKFRANV
jgi:membrane-associated phospholipid phosphatase